jgi:murein DD-endopeptidase MepM/ murein hydrolase activator NlpD
MALPAPAAKLQDITAGWRYSSGGDHFAYDYGMPTGTPLYAVARGKIIGTNDGVRNNYKQRPSNYVLLRIKHKGKYATLYYQHMSPGLKVKEGQYVEAGQLLGYSGNSGWSSGPHLHLAAGWGSWTESDRYAYMRNDGKNSIVIFPPTNLYKYTWGIGSKWYGYKASFSAGSRWKVLDGKANARDTWWVKMIQAQLGVKQTGYFGPVTAAAVKKWNLAHGYTTQPTVVNYTRARRMGLPV